MLLKIDPEVLKVRDPRVALLASARMSAKGFALSIRKGDPFLLVGDTVYALTEREYYVANAVYAPAEMSVEAFRDFVVNADLSAMSGKDRSFVEGIRGRLGKCTACQARHYRDAVYSLARKYGMPVELSRTPDPPKYPETDGEIVSRIPGGLDAGRPANTARRSCIDCVEKHLAQAYVLGCESRNGYPDYLPIAIGHMAEALAEMPKTVAKLRETVEFCLALSQCDREVFMPLGAVLPLLYASRAEFDQDRGDGGDVPDRLLGLDLGADAAKEIGDLPEHRRKAVAEAVATISNIALECKIHPKEAAFEWEGRMACLSDSISDACPEAASVIRARRLAFVGNPVLAGECGYGMEDVAEAASR